MLAFNAPGLNSNDLCDYLKAMDREEVTKLNQETGPANIQADPCVASMKGATFGGAIGLGFCGALAFGIPGLGLVAADILIFGTGGVVLGAIFGRVAKGQEVLPWRDRYVEKGSERYARIRGKVTMIDHELDEAQLDKRIRQQLNLAKMYFQSTAECYNKEVNVSVSHYKYG